MYGECNISVQKVELAKWVKIPGKFLAFTFAQIPLYLLLQLWVKEKGKLGFLVLGGNQSKENFEFQTVDKTKNHTTIFPIAIPR